MAVDTLDKRSSAIGVSPGVYLFPTPDGAIDSLEDRSHTAGLYRLPITDVTAPVFTVGPTITTVSSTAIQIEGTVTDEMPPITVYVVAVPDGDPAPSIAQIQAGTDSADAAAPNNSEVVTLSGDSFSLNIGGLTATTAYDIYYTASDSVGNDTTPAKLDVTTAAESVASGTIAISAWRRRRG